MATTAVVLDTSQYVRVTTNPLVPSSLLLQSHRDTVRIAFSELQPSRGNTVFHELGGEHPLLPIPMTEIACWALAMTEHSSLTATEQRVPVVVDEGIIFGRNRVVSRVDVNILRGEMWAGSTLRTGISVDDTYFQVIRTGSTKWMILEDIVAEVDFSNVEPGRFTLTIKAFVQGSSGNNFSYDLNTGTVTSLGRNLRLDRINTFTEAVLEKEPTGQSYSGVEDFSLIFREHFLDIVGNRETISSNEATFFNGDRRILIPPNSEVLFITETYGDSDGTVDVRSNFFVSETKLLG